MSQKKFGQVMQAAFRRASFCASNECTEVGQRDGMVVVRDSTQPDGVVLQYALVGWASFVRDIKQGKFEGP